jgi:polar amino acid transport system substrate-binding protein
VATLGKRFCFAALLTGLMVAMFSLPARADPPNLPSTTHLNLPVDLRTTEWPPYSSETLPGQGIASIIVRAAFAHEKIPTRIAFMPWQRSLQQFDTDILPNPNQRADAIFPVYADLQRQEHFFLSRAIVHSPVGFVYYRGTSFDWQTLDDLSHLTIGVVRGYANRADFDRRVDQGLLHVVKAHDDITLLRLLSAGRVDIAVMDQLVMRHILDTKPDFSQNRRWFYFHPNILENKTLHVGFRRTAAGKALREAFDRGLRALQCPDNDCPVLHIPANRFPSN